MPQSPSQPPGIFICYRRDDTAGHAGRLYDRLNAHFGNGQIFIDIDLIEPGEDFVQAVEAAVGSCEILLALIGRNWLASRDQAGRRLDNPNDFVRLEIATALSRGIRVIPVLVQSARMPDQQDLPEDLGPLLRRNALELSDLRWNYDVDQLIGALERVRARQREAREEAERREEGAEALKRKIKEPAELKAGQVELDASALKQGRPEAEGGAADAPVATVAEIKRRVKWTWQDLGDYQRVMSWVAIFTLLVVAGVLLLRYGRTGSLYQSLDKNPSLVQPTPGVGGLEGQGSGRLKDQGFKNALGMEFVWVPPGEFMMGSENGDPDERPVRRVTIGSGFYLGKYEVTQAQWQVVIGHNPSHFEGERLPVENVSWSDAQQFIEKLNQSGDGYVYRLPTEADWEYAARAGTTGDYSDDLPSMAWYDLNSDGTTHPVGQKQANGFGLYDMNGNVYEWVLDFYDSYESAQANASVSSGRSNGQRVIRGGSYSSRATFCRSSRRSYHTQYSRARHLGFRVAANAKQ